MSPKDFKYTTKFQFPVHTLYASEQGPFISEASLNELKQIAPQELEIKGNYDLLYNVFNAAVINRINKNDDGISAATAVSIFKQFIHKPCNLEHKRDLVVGHIISAGFAEYKTNKIYDEATASSTTNPFYLSLGAVVYKLVDPEFCDLLIDASDETSSSYNSISTSWEIGFNEYDIVLGNRDISQGRIITDKKDVEAYSKFLRVYGGNGKLDDGTPVYRLIKGEVLPLGIGYTTKPAADVQGVLVLKNTNVNMDGEDDPEDDEQESMDSIVLEASETGVVKEVENQEKSAATIKEEELLQNQENNKNISSQTISNTVKTTSIMKIKSIEDITDESLQEVSAANFREFIAEQIDKSSSEYADKLEQAKKELEAKANEKDSLKTDFEELSKQLESVKEELQKEKEARATEKAQADFNDRMSELESKFNLTDKDKQIIAKSIKDKDEASYAEWLSDWTVIAEHKNKSFKPANASLNTVEEVLDNAGAPNTPSINNVITDSASQKAKWAEHFKLEDIINLNR